ncbi:spore coat U domain-containing protein [Novosphingobium sp.]|jgi:spore coat protein U-like protein|uniref:Csu type fimbrial protein n=1 Tax=Novosphingobium sp. TaxID=1874826 RepID=UPI0028B24DB3|nr:spore coat U domain-containing protein [Novosphingobium sp.]
MDKDLPSFRRISVGAVTVLATALAFLAPSRSIAATATAPMAVTATVQSACIVAVTPLAFGAYDPTSGSVKDGASTVTVTCTSGTSFTVGLNAGSTSGATVTTRQMINGSNRLNYALYSDINHTTNWGNTPGTDTPTATTATAVPSVLNVYGRIGASQNVPAGAYSDSVTVTVNY